MVEKLRARPVAIGKGLRIEHAIAFSGEHIAHFHPRQIMVTNFANGDRLNELR
ncbi:hypothetical protein D3C76_1683760 [compost metagenome]